MLRRRPSNASEKEPMQKKKLTLQRSSSFKDFMKHKPTSPVSVDKEFTLDESVTEGAQVEDAAKSGIKLGKKWRNVISRTMTRKTSKMVQKALAEEGADSCEDLSPVSPDFVPDLGFGQRTSVCSTGSEDTVPSPTRQLSGNSDRQSLDSGYSQRDSMRLEENSYNGPFCGRAVVHTDFTPSPYDVESLKLQKGDIIHIIDKPPVGTWTGKLNNKVGSFKFIYVNMLPDESPSSKRRQRRRKKSRSKTKPTSLEEVLDSIGLTELNPLLSMHGFQSLEDFTGLRESHLNELNITDPEQRTKILNATDLFRDSDEESESGEDGDGSVKDAKEPRDSGCFESSENLDNARDENKSNTPQTTEDTSDTKDLPKQEEVEEVDAVQRQMEELTLNEDHVKSS